MFEIFQGLRETQKYVPVTVAAGLPLFCNCKSHDATLAVLVACSKNCETPPGQQINSLRFSERTTTTFPGPRVEASGPPRGTSTGDT